jgi:hypothetical protein
LSSRACEDENERRPRSPRVTDRVDYAVWLEPGGPGRSAPCLTLFDTVPGSRNVALSPPSGESSSAIDPP